MTSKSPNKSNKPGKARRSRPGRPQGGDSDVRQRLLETTIQIAAAEGVAAVSIRRVASAAQVSSAMVHYYFGSRDGLLDAMLEFAVQPLLQSLGALNEAQQNANAQLPGLAQLMATALQHLARHHWLPLLVVRDVLGHPGPFREQFIERIARRGRNLLVAMVEREQAAGRIRAELDPVLTALSLLSMLVFPLLALPISSALYGVSLDPEFLSRLSAHHQQILRGLQP